MTTDYEPVYDTDRPERTVPARDHGHRTPGPADWQRTRPRSARPLYYGLLTVAEMVRTRERQERYRRAAA